MIFILFAVSYALLYRVTLKHPVTMVWEKDILISMFLPAKWKLESCHLITDLSVRSNLIGERSVQINKLGCSAKISWYRDRLIFTDQSRQIVIHLDKDHYREALVDMEMILNKHSGHWVKYQTNYCRVRLIKGKHLKLEIK